MNTLWKNLKKITNFEEKQVQIGKEESILEQKSDEQGTDSNSSNANLQAFRLNYEGLTPQFDKDIYEYYLTIPNTINDLEVLTVTENPDATVEITGTNRVPPKNESAFGSTVL